MIDYGDYDCYKKNVDNSRFIQRDGYFVTYKVLYCYLYATVHILSAFECHINFG